MQTLTVAGIDAVVRGVQASITADGTLTVSIEHAKLCSIIIS
jgi:hypothetical protein